MSIFPFDFLFCAVGIDDIGILQLSHQVGFDGINIDSAQLVPFCQLLALAASSLIRAITSFIVILFTSFIVVDHHRNSTFFCCVSNGGQLYFTQSPHGDLTALRGNAIRFLTNKTV